jgi:hypothetical protein
VARPSQSIDEDSIKGALQLNEYCEKLLSIAAEPLLLKTHCESMSKELLISVEDSFATQKLPLKQEWRICVLQPYCDELYKGAYEVWTNHKGKERILRKSKVPNRTGN